MKKIKQVVPSGRDIKYISEWSEYKIPSGHCIVDKGVTGCGYTEYTLTNNFIWIFFLEYFFYPIKIKMYVWYNNSFSHFINKILKSKKKSA